MERRTMPSRIYVALVAVAVGMTGLSVDVYAGGVGTFPCPVTGTINVIWDDIQIGSIPIAGPRAAMGTTNAVTLPTGRTKGYKEDCPTLALGRIRLKGFEYQGTEKGSDWGPQMDLRGKVIAFDAEFTGTITQVYVLDVAASQVTQITNGAAPSYMPSVSGDGQWVAFCSDEDLLGSGSTTTQIFLHDVSTGTLRQITAGATGQSLYPSLDKKGKWLAFSSSSDLFGVGLTNHQIYMFHRPSGTLHLITQAPAGDCYRPSISVNGKRVTFISSYDLWGGMLHATQQIYLFDTPTKFLVKVTDDPTGHHLDPRLSHDGRRIVWWSDGDPLGIGTAGAGNVFMVNINLGVGAWNLTQITQATAGMTMLPEPNRNGRRVIFQSSEDLMGTGAAGVWQVYVWDEVRQDLYQLGEVPAGKAAYKPEIDGRGKKIVMKSDADLLGLGSTTYGLVGMKVR